LLISFAVSKAACACSRCRPQAAARARSRPPRAAQVRGAALVCISIIATLVVLAVTRRKPAPAGDEAAGADMRLPAKARHSDLVA
jgi:hypothetical protein